jgi:hypothetical protein
MYQRIQLPDWCVNSGSHVLLGCYAEQHVTGHNIPEDHDLNNIYAVRTNISNIAKNFTLHKF